MEDSLVLMVHAELSEGASTRGLTFVRNVVPDLWVLMMYHQSVVFHLDSKTAVWPTVQNNDTQNYTIKFERVLLLTKCLY